MLCTHVCYARRVHGLSMIPRVEPVATVASGGSKAISGEGSHGVHWRAEPAAGSLVECPSYFVAIDLPTQDFRSCKTSFWVIVV